MRFPAGIIGIMEQLEFQLAARDRHRRASAAQQSYEQRMTRFWQMQQSSARYLLASPEGYRRFLQRNFKARAIDVNKPNA